MTESFVMAAFQKMGEPPQNVKVMRNKYTGEPAGYCFVHFATDEAALNAMHKLSGKVIPNTNPVCINNSLSNISNPVFVPLQHKTNISTVCFMSANPV
jgi:RNA-binding proteins (RRM domain)